MLLLPIPLIHRRRGRPKRTVAPPSPPVPAPLVLVAAEYAESTWVQLTFDRPINIAALVGSQVLVDDGQKAGVLYEAVGAATLIGPATVRIELLDVQAATVSDVRLIATAFTGIAAADDGGTWEGVSGLELPFP